MEISKSKMEAFTYLRQIELGDIIKIQVDGKPESVELVRRGRQSVRVRREGEEETFLVDVGDVCVD